MAAGWNYCCCCAIIYMYWCDDCFCDADWLAAQFDPHTGEWSCDASGVAECDNALWEATGSGRMVSRVPLALDHRASISWASIPGVGDKIGLIVGWTDDENYIEITYEVTGALTATAEIVVYADGVPDVAETCSITLPPGTASPHAGGIDACFQDGFLRAEVPALKIAHDVGTMGQLVGFWHSTASAFGYRGFFGYELDSPDWPEPEPFCDTCLSCGCGDQELRVMPPRLTATLLLSGDDWNGTGNSFACSDPVFDGIWNGLAFEMKPPEGCATQLGGWEGDLLDPIGPWSDGLDDTGTEMDGRFHRYRLECPETTVMNGFPWDYAGPWKMFIKTLFTPPIGADECYPYTRKPYLFQFPFYAAINEHLSTCSPLVLVFDGECAVANWNDEHRIYPAVCVEALRGYFQDGYALIRFRFVLTAGGITPAAPAASIETLRMLAAGAYPTPSTGLGGWTVSQPSRGPGDTIAKITHATGIAQAVHAISQLTGIDCGCKERQAWLNAKMPYKIKEPPAT